MNDVKQKTDEANEYVIPVSWSVFSTVVVKGAKSLQEAIELVEKYSDDIPLPHETQYINASFEVDVETDEDAEYAQDCGVRGTMLDISSGKPEYHILKKEKKHEHK